MPTYDAVVIGAGLAGLSAGIGLAEAGARVFVAGKGMGATHWAHGGVDVGDVEALSRRRGHPYARFGDAVGPALTAHLARLAAAGLPYRGSPGDTPRLVPTAVGGLRPAAILPEAQAAGLQPWAGGEGLLMLGIDRFKDVWAQMAARNLARQRWPDGPAEVRWAVAELPWVERLHNLTALELARLFDDPDWRARALAQVRAALPDGTWRIGLPAVLGLARHAEVFAEARETLGAPIFEIPSLPPSVPGIRLFEALRERLLAAGGRFQFGFGVVKVERSADHVVAVHTQGASRTLRLAASEFVLATGGIAGGGLRATADGMISERVFGLAVEAPPQAEWLVDDPLAEQPLESAGVRVDARLRPAGVRNVRVIGSMLAGQRYLSERCGDGVALASAQRAVQLLSARSAWSSVRNVAS